MKKSETILSKAEEMQEMSVFINHMNTFKGGTYIGDWLRAVYPYVETLLRQDIIPDMTPQDGVSACETLKAQCENECLALYAKAEKAVKDADDYFEREKAKVRSAIGDAISKIESAQFKLR